VFFCLNGSVEDIECGVLSETCEVDACQPGAACC
jgi:hypothetical protein